MDQENLTPNDVLQLAETLQNVADALSAIAYVGAAAVVVYTAIICINAVCLTRSERRDSRFATRF